MKKCDFSWMYIPNHTVRNPLANNPEELPGALANMRYFCLNQKNLVHAFQENELGNIFYEFCKFRQAARKHVI